MTGDGKIRSLALPASWLHLLRELWNKCGMAIAKLRGLMRSEFDHHSGLHGLFLSTTP